MAITTAAKKRQQEKRTSDMLEQFSQPLRVLTSPYPDAKCEFISELSASITKWRSRPGQDAAAFATAYETILCNLLTPDEA